MLPPLDATGSSLAPDRMGARWDFNPVATLEAAQKIWPSVHCRVSLISMRRLR